MEGKAMCNRRGNWQSKYYVKADRVESSRMRATVALEGRKKAAVRRFGLNLELPARACELATSANLPKGVAFKVWLVLSGLCLGRGNKRGAAHETRDGRIVRSLVRLSC